MWKFLIRINKNLVLTIPILMLFGILFGAVADPATVSSLKKFIIPLTFLMVYPMMVTLNIKHLKSGMNVQLQGVTQLINFGVIPFVAYILGRLFFPEQPYMALGLLLASLLPTSGMTISWTGFAKGNMGAAINMTVIGLTLGSLVTPFYVSWLLGAQVEVNLMKVVQQIVFIVFLPMVAGYFTRQALLKKYGLSLFKERIAPRFPAVSTVGVLGIVFVAMALKAKTIFASPEVLLVIITPLLILYCINFVLSTLIGKTLFNREDGIALVYGTVMRNLSIAQTLVGWSYDDKSEFFSKEELEKIFDITKIHNILPQMNSFLWATFGDTGGYTSYFIVSAALGVIGIVILSIYARISKKEKATS